MLHHEIIPAMDGSRERLLVMLHGLGDSIEGYRWLPEVFQLPWLNYALVNAPDPYYGGYSWYDFAGNIAPGVRRSTRLVIELLDHLRSGGFTAENTVLGGFSQGCLMAIEVALRYPHRFAGVMGVSGYVCEPETLVREMSPVAVQQKLLITHGTLDPILPFAQSRAQIAFLKQAGLQVEWHEFVKAHTIAGEAELGILRKFIIRVLQPASVSS